MISDPFAQRELLVEVLRDRFASALAIGTQMSLSRSLRGLREFLGELTYTARRDSVTHLDTNQGSHGRYS